MVIEDICGATTCNMSVRFYTKLAFFAIVASRVVRPLAFLQKAVVSSVAYRVHGMGLPYIASTLMCSGWLLMPIFDRKLDFASSPMNKYTGIFLVHMAIIWFIRITSNLKLIKQENSGYFEQYTGAFHSCFLALQCIVKTSGFK